MRRPTPKATSGGNLQPWWDRFGSKFIAAVDLLNLAIEKGLLAATIGDKSPQSQKIRIGRTLSAMRDRQFGDYRITIRRDSRTKNQTYGLVNASDGACGTPAEIVDLFEYGAASSATPPPRAVDLVDFDLDVDAEEDTTNA